jgi:hypothetical protein
MGVEMHVSEERKQLEAKQRAATLTEKAITDSVKKWFPDRAYQAPFFARALIAEHNGGVRMLTEKQRMNLLLHADDMEVSGHSDDAKALRAILASAGQAVKVYPQGVMGIPPYEPPGSSSHGVSDALTYNAAPTPAAAQAVRVCEISDIQCSRGCGVGDCNREREARYPVEQPAAARDERASEVDGTFACPICGRTTPHEHSAEEQIAHRNLRKKIPDWHEGTLMEILEKAGLRFQYRNEDVRSAVIAGIKWGFDRGAESAAPAAPAVAPHPDDEAVDVFACAMKAKMAAARDKGRAGWERIDPVELSIMLREHVEKGDPRDVANFCMMLWHHGARISDAALPMGKRAAPAPAEPKGEQHEGERCNACHGSGWVVRDPDIGTDQECFVCDGTGTVEPEQRAATLSDEQAHEMYMRAAKAIEGKPRADTGFKGWCGAFIQSLVAILAAHNGGKNAD